MDSKILIEGVSSNLVHPREDIVIVIAMVEGHASLMVSWAIILKDVLIRHHQE